MTHTANNPSSTGANADLTADGNGGFSLTSDAQPYYDDCSTRDAVAMSGKNIGDLLNAKGLSWGWFQGGFRPSTPYATALTDISVTQPTSTFVPDQFKTLGASLVTGTHASNQGICNAVTPVGAELPASLGTGTGQYGYKDDYIPHHEPFQYYASTANPHHLTIPTSASGKDTLAGLKTIGTDTQSYVAARRSSTGRTTSTTRATSTNWSPRSARANCRRRHCPRCRSSRRRAGQDGHAGYSDPLDEQYSGHQRDQRAGEDPGLEEHRGRHLLRRLGRLVRPRVLRCDQPVHLGWRRPHRRPARAAPAHRWRARTAAAATARGCRCSSSRPGRSPTSSTTRRPTRPRSSSSSRTTGGCRAHLRQLRLDLGQPERHVRLRQARRRGRRPGQALPQPDDRGTGLVAASHQTA